MAVAQETLNAPHHTDSEAESAFIPLKMTQRSVDIDIDFSKVNPDNIIGKIYEDECFKRVIEELGPSEVAYGAHFLNRAFNSHLKARGVSIPDALVGEVDYSTQVLDQSGIPVDRPVIRVKRIIEARTGEINGIYKLKRFENLTVEMRRNPDFFTLSIRNLLAGRGGVLNLAFLFAPPDGELEVDFYSPHQHTEREVADAKRQLGEHPFRKIGYKTVPLPIFTPAV